MGKHPIVVVAEWAAAWVRVRGGPAGGEKKRTCLGTIGPYIWPKHTGSPEKTVEHLPSH